MNFADVITIIILASIILSVCIYLMRSSKNKTGCCGKCGGCTGCSNKPS